MTEATTAQRIDEYIAQIEAHADIIKSTAKRLEDMAETHHANLELSPGLEVCVYTAQARGVSTDATAALLRTMSREFRRDGSVQEADKLMDLLLIFQRKLRRAEDTAAEVAGLEQTASDGVQAANEKTLETGDRNDD